MPYIPIIGASKKESAQHRHDAEKHEENISAIISVVASIDGIATEQKATRDEQACRENARRLREWLTIIALVVTAAVGGYGIWRTHKDTVAAINEAHVSADQQHRDTLDAIAKTNALALAARDQATMNRAQIWVDPDPNPDFGEHPEMPDMKNGVARARYRLMFRLVNYGNTRAVITGFSSHFYICNKTCRSRSD